MEKTIEILITLPFPDGLVDKLKRISTQVNVTVEPAKTADDISPSTWNKVEILYTSNVLPNPEQAPRLRWVQFHSAGVNRLLPEPILHKDDVTATTLSGAHAPQMGEYILMMMLALGHRMPLMLAKQREQNWPENRWEMFKPQELQGATVGIVGYGSIGREVARLLQPYNVTTLVSKRNAMQPEDTGYTPQGFGDPEGQFFRRLYPVQALKSMVKECDYVVVTTPLTPETRHLIAEEELAAMKPTAFIIDISRGGVIKSEALIAALNKGQIGGAALDVFPDEPLTESSPYWQLPNTIISPHISGISSRYDERAIELFVANLQRYITGHRLYNIIDLERGY